MPERSQCSDAGADRQRVRARLNTRASPLRTAGGRCLESSVHGDGIRTVRIGGNRSSPGGRSVFHVQNRQSVHEGTAARWTEQVRSRYVRVRGDRQFRPGRHDSASLAANDYASGSQLRQSLDVFLPSPAVQPQKRGRSIHFDRPTTSKGTISRMRPDIRALPQINSC